MLPGAVAQLLVALGLTILGWAALEKSWLLGSLGLSLVVAVLLVPYWPAL
ncbi:MAG TPA: hypothetical protein VGH54_23965 [Mycobacterium sp.]|jgi:hypothetical protein